MNPTAMCLAEPGLSPGKKKSLQWLNLARDVAKQKEARGPAWPLDRGAAC